MLLWISYLKDKPEIYDVSVNSAYFAIKILETNLVTQISISQHLKHGQGTDVLAWIGQQASLGAFRKIPIYVHEDQNADKLVKVISAIEFIWSKNGQ